MRVWVGGLRGRTLAVETEPQPIRRERDKGKGTWRRCAHKGKRREESCAVGLQNVWKPERSGC